MKIEEISKTELKEKADQYVEACNVHGLVHAKEGGVIYLSDLLTDFIKYLKTNR